MARRMLTSTAMTWQPLQPRLGGLPLLLAGPMLRRVTPTSVTVWVALQQAATVKLTVHDRDHTPRSAVMPEAGRSTIAVGANLHIVAVTARTATPLIEGQLYFYDLSFTVGSTTMSLAQAAQVPPGQTPFAYPPFVLPSFALPPTDLNKLRLIHGSCRKPNAEGPDALAYLDGLIAETAQSADGRPHQLLLTGDQIYADEVAEPLLMALTDAGETLLGPGNETLPAFGSSGPFKPSDLPPYNRYQLLQDVGFTSVDLRSHLMWLGEYLAMYLFVWSDVLWPPSLPTYSDLWDAIDKALSDRKEYLVFSDDILEDLRWQDRNGALALIHEEIIGLTERVDQFRSTIHGQPLSVRRALANIPTYMICDDHEITDDWNLSRGFCDKVYGEPLGRRIVQNGLTAFALCQLWGNTPEQFEDIGPPPAGQKLLNRVHNPALYEAEIQQIVGIHTPDQLRAHTPDYAVFHDPGTAGAAVNDTSLRFDFTIEGPSHQILVTDTRSWRSFPRPGREAHSDLLAANQLIAQIDGSPPLAGRLLMVVVTTNIPPIAAIRFAGLLPGWVTHENDFLDSWEIPSPALDRMIVKLSDKLKPAAGPISGGVVLLSGDVHHSYASRMSYHAEIRLDDPALPQPARVVFAQLVSSAFHNQAEKTRYLHKEGYNSSVGHPLAGYASKVMPHWAPEMYAGWDVKRLGGSLIVGEYFAQTDNNQPVIVPLVVDTNHPSVFVGRPPNNYIPNYSTKLTTAPHYHYRLDFLAPEAAATQPALIPPVVGNQPILLETFRASLDAYRQYAKIANGREIVGLNNLAEVTLEADPKDPREKLQTVTRVHHTVRWREPGETNLRWARYSVSMDPQDHQYDDIPSVGGL